MDRRRACVDKSGGELSTPGSRAIPRNTPYPNPSPKSYPNLCPNQPSVPVQGRTSCGSFPIRSARRRGRTRYSPRVRAPRAPVEVREYAGRGEARVGEGGRGQGRPGGCLGHAVEDVFLRRVLVEDPVERELEVAHLHIVPGRVLAASITRWQALVLWLYVLQASTAPGCAAARPPCA